MKSDARPTVAALIMLLLINAANYADRSIVIVLQEAIKHDLKLSDFQLGLLAGPAFALFYAVMGIPIARLAERVSRPRIIVVAVVLWSSFTAACGLAQNFGQLALWRMGVGATEAGAPPASHALIADYYPRANRGRAMALMALGVPIGMLAGSMLSGAVASATSWRWAFAIIGLPGLLIALVSHFLLFEPREQHNSGAASATPRVKPTGFSKLLSSPGYRSLLLIAAISGFAANGVANFAISFFVRVHGFTLAQSSGLLGLGLGVFGVLGTLASGIAADKFEGGNGRSYFLVPAIASVLSGTLAMIAFSVSNGSLAIGIYIFQIFFGFMIVSPTFAAVQNVVDPRSRATAAAVFLLCITVFGAMGPAVVGYISDLVAAHSLQLGLDAYKATCPGGRAIAGAAIGQDGLCRAAAIQGLRTAIIVPCGAYLPLFLAYMLGARVAMPEMRSVQSHQSGEQAIA